MLDKFRHPAWASSPESDGQMPGTQPMTPEQYFEMLSANYGRIAADIVKLREEIGAAEDKHAMVQVSTLGQMYTIPTGPWRSVVISRPSYAETFVSGAAFNSDVWITFDNTMSGIVSYDGVTVFPYLGFNAFKLYPFGNPAANWSISVFFTSRLYEFTSYVGF